MELKKFFSPAPKLRPQLNLGCLFDIPNGRYYIGRNGESILNGGLAYFTGVAGKGNTFKSTIMHYMTLVIVDRFKCANAMVYDTEMSLTTQRLYQLAAQLPHIGGLDLEEHGRLMLTDGTSMIGNVWFKALSDFSKEKLKDAKSWTFTTPFIDHKTGANFTALAPTPVELDSLSMFTTDSVGNIYEKNSVGDSGANTDALRGAAAKSQMLMQIPTMTAACAIYLLTSAHVGKQHQLDPYAPPAKQLQYLKGQNAFKHVPEKFSFITNNLYFISGAQTLLNKTTKCPEYPSGPDDNVENDPDLQLITIQNLRAKAGPTGFPYELIVSQREGLLVGLSELNYLKSFDRFGIGGNDRTYFLELCPDINLSRTTVRTKLNESAKLRRAMEMTSELCQMTALGYQTETTRESLSGEEEIREKDLVCTAKELYDDLKAKGYDWDVLLDTRGYWIFEEHAKDEKPFLSTMDLLRMRAGLYHPYWLPKK